MVNASEESRTSPALFVAAALAQAVLVMQGFWHLNVYNSPMEFWPAAGFAVWLVTRFGNRLFFAILLGELLAYELRFIVSSDDLSRLATTTTALANALTAIVAARLWHHGMARWSGRLGEFSEAPSLLLAALIAPTVSALAGVGSLLLTEGVQRADAGQLLLNWWLGDSLGILIVLPLLFAAPAILSDIRSAGAARRIQGVILCTLLVAASWWIFWLPDGGPLLFTLLPLLLLATATLGQSGALLAVLIIATVSFAALAAGQQPFQGSAEDNMLISRMFLMALALMAMMLRVFQAQGGLLRRLALALLLGGWTLSAWLFGSAQIQDKADNALEFAKLARNAEDAIATRMSIYTDALRSGSSFVLASDSVSRAEWRAFAESMDLPGRYPGIRGVGVIYSVPSNESEAYLQRVRADEVPEFTIHAPPGGLALPGGEEWVITYLEPVAGNHAALGVNVASEPVRRLAAATARDTGKPQITSRLTLVQDSMRRPGFLLYRPVYRRGLPTDTVAERRAALDAWVYAPFVTEEFMEGTLGTRGEKLDLHMFEQGRMDQAHLVFSSGKSAEGQGSPGQIPSEFERTTSFNLAGNVFTLGWNRGPGFESRRQMLIFWLAGLIALAPLVLVGWILSVMTFRERAERLVATRTAALSESEFRWKFAIEGSGDGLWDWDVQKKTVFRSNRWKQLLGFADDEVGSTLDEWERLVHPDHRARVAADTKTHLDGNTPFFLSEYRVACKDGSWKWVLDRGVVVARDSEGKPQRVIGTLADISKRKQAETVLTKTTGLLKRTGEVAKVGGWELDLETRELSWSDEVFRIMEFDSRSEPGLEQAMNLCHVQDRQALLAAIRAAIRDRTPWDIEVRMTTAQRRDIWLRILGSAEAGNEKVTKLLGAIQDVTIRKQAEYALWESQAKFQSAFDSSPLGMALVSLEGKWTQVNSRLCSMLGYSKDELLALGIRGVTHPEDLEATTHHLRQILSADVDSFTTTKKYLARGEQIVWVMVATAPVRNNQGQATYFVSQISDITEQRQAQESIGATLREKEALLREVHHRVKNNLQVITSLLRLETGRSEHPPTRSVLMDMQARIHSMALLHETLYRSGNFAAVDLGAYLGKLSEQVFRSQAGDPEAVRLVLDLTSAVAVMDQAIPCGLLVNELVSNCLKHGFPDRRTGEVRLELQAVDGGPQLRLRVSDSGKGLPPDFEALRGNSLGLQLVSDLTAQLQGTLEIGPGPAAEFTVTFTPSQPIT